MIALVGDVLPTRGLAYGLNIAPGFEQLVERLRAAHLAIGNFEMPLTRGGDRQEKLLTIRADPEVAEDVGRLGLDVVTVANNHSHDYGWAGLSETMELLQRQGLQVIGAGPTRAAAAQPAICRLPECTVGVLPFSCLLPPGAGALDDRAGISPIRVESWTSLDPAYVMEEPGDAAAITLHTRVSEEALAHAQQCVQRAREQVDFLIVTIHWGFGAGDELADYQQPLGHALIDAGADIVHGHHVHTVHPVELYRGKLILYGLGTFVGQQTYLPATPQVQAMWREMSREGLVAQIEILSDGSYELTVIPTLLGHERLAEPAETEELDAFIKRLNRLSAPFGSHVAMLDEGFAIRPDHAGAAAAI